MKLVLGSAFLAMTLFSCPAWAQSLKSDAPAPLQAGINRGTIDNMVGAHYWFFTGGPGKTHVHVKFKAMGLLGNPYRSTITVTLYDAGNTWRTPKILSSDSQDVDCTFEGDVKSPTKILLSVAPPPNGLVRMGGNYEIDATGAVGFGQKSNADPVIGTYKQMSGYTSLLGTCKFLPNGTIETTSGASGTWKLFDQATQSYVINVDGQERQSFQYKSGRGLCDTDNSVIFQELK